MEPEGTQFLAFPNHLPRRQLPSMTNGSTGSFSSMSKTDFLITQHTIGAVGMVDILCHRPAFGQSPPLGRSWACAELSALLGSLFCVSSLHGIVALGSGVHQDADPPFLLGTPR